MLTHAHAHYTLLKETENLVDTLARALIIFQIIKMNSSCALKPISAHIVRTSEVFQIIFKNVFKLSFYLAHTHHLKLKKMDTKGYYFIHIMYEIKCSMKPLIY